MVINEMLMMLMVLTKMLMVLNKMLMVCYLFSCIDKLGKN